MVQFNYKWGILSPNDPTQRPLGYETKEQAERMAEHMNSLIPLWDLNEHWNKDHWKEKPKPFEVIPL